MSPSKSNLSVDETRRSLIEAGRQVFSEDGFDGARVDRIAELAGVNKALINYHFGGKQQLFQAIIEDFTAQLATGLQSAIDPTASPEDQLRQFVRHMANAVARHPEFPRLMLFESTKKNALPDPPPQHMLLVMQTLAKILDQGYRAKRFKRLNPFFAHFHMMSSFAFYHVGRPLRERLRGKFPIPEEVFSTEAFNAFVEDQILSGFALQPTRNSEGD